MATTTWKLPGTAANGVTGETGTVGWTSVDNIKVESASAAQAFNNIGGFGTKDTRTLRATNFGFTSSDIPAGSLIVGIEIQINRKAAISSGATDTTVRLVSGSAGSTSDRVGSNKADTVTAWGITTSDAFYGGSSDDWGAGLTHAAVTSASFGFDFEAHLSYNNRADVQFVRARITYLPPISAALSVTEDDDTISGAGGVAIKADANITEADDTLIATNILETTLDIDFTTGVLDSRITFSRTSIATRINASGQIESVASGAPRFDYDPVTLLPLGLLIEQNRVNYLLNSLLNGTSLSTQSLSVTAQTYTLSFYGTGSIALSGAATGTLTGTGAFPARSTLTFTPTAGTLTLTVSGTVQYAQLETGSFATSFIPTAGAAASRSADYARITGTDFSSWFNPSEGTLIVDYNITVLYSTAQRTLATINQTAAPGNNRLHSYLTGASAPAFYVAVAGATQMSSGSFPISKGLNRVANAYRADDFAICGNGQPVSTDTSGTIPTVDRLEIGVFNNGASESLNDRVARVRFYSQRISNSLLRAFTGMTGSAVIAEAGDTLAAAGKVYITASSSIAEANDTLSAAAIVWIKGIANLSEASDSITATAAARVKGAAALVEAGDGMVAAAKVFIRAASTITEADDVASSTADSGPAAIPPPERTLTILGSTLAQRTLQLTGPTLALRTLTI